jgi:hypothetical protein
MRKIHKASTLVVLLLPGIPGAVRAQSVDPLTQREITRLMAQAVPHINAVLAADDKDARPMGIPRLQLLTPAEFRRLPDPETDAIVRAHFGALSARAALDRAYQACAAVALVRFRPGTDTIAVSVPVDEKRIASWSSTALPDAPELAANRTLQLALVHETVLMYLDQAYHWTQQLARCRDEDEVRITLTLVEGRARQVTDLVADKLGSYIYAGALAQRYRAFPDDGPDPEKSAVIRAVAFRTRLDAENQGKAFFEHLAHAQVKPLEATAFTNPPRQLLWITRPELYVKARHGELLDLTQLLKKLEAVRPPPVPVPPLTLTLSDAWVATEQTLGPDMVREVAKLVQEQPRAEAVLRGWEEARVLIWTHPNVPGQIAISVTRFDSPAAARAYHGFAIDLQRKRDDPRNNSCTGACQLLEWHSEAVPIARADAAVRYCKKIQPAGGQPTSVDMLYVLAGTMVIEFDAFGISLDSLSVPSWPAHVLEAILATGAPPAPTPAR